MKSPRFILVAAMVVASLTSPGGFADDRMGDQLGTIHFEVSGKPGAQEHVVRGVKLLHHMMYTEADDEFSRAAEIDPACALAWWGRAMTIIHPLWPDTPIETERQQGAAFIKQGLACPAPTSRERAYLETLNVYFDGPATSDYPAQLKALDVAWSALSDKYPDDLDAVSFSALYHLAPARFLTKDRSYRLQLQAAAQLQAVLAKIPDHPGAQHYKIHAHDFPMLADRALEVCDTYSSIAPDVPHALHMPTHIYTRRGLWEKSIEFNRRSSDAARKLARTAGVLNSHYPHALDYLIYAYLQTGQYRLAESIRVELPSLQGPYSAAQPGAIAFAFAAIPARYALERQAWQEAMELPLHQPAAFLWGKEFLHCDSIIYFARAIGAARTGHLDEAQTGIAALEQVYRDLAASKKPAYWATQAQTQLLTVRAWVLLAEKKSDGALALMRSAVELEANTNKEAVTPGEVLPAGDLLGDMLLELERPVDAMAAFEGVLAASPRRLNTLYGAGLAAERAGNSAKALKYFGELSESAAHADSGIPRVEYARNFLAKNTAVASR